MVEKLDFMDTEKIGRLFQEAVIKAVEAHYQQGESIAVSDGEGKVKIVPAHEIPALLEGLKSKEIAKS